MTMEVHIKNIVSTVRAVDGDALVSPRKMEELMQAFLTAADERDDHRRRVRAERRITGGVAHEQAEEA